MRQPELFIEHYDQGDGLGPEMGAGRPERVGGLQRMPPLDATPTGAAPADVHVEAAHVGTHDRQILLDLRRDTRLGDVAVALGTRRRERDIDDLVDVRWRQAMRMTPVLAPRPSASGPRLRHRRALGERRGLPLARALRGRQRLRQTLNLAAQPIALALHARDLVPQALAALAQLLILLPQALQLRLAGHLRGTGLSACTHATVMPESPPKYK
ncbi:MAG TPA: hypothetical protein VGD94_20205 [Vicinamibacterales bacterium]